MISEKRKKELFDEYVAYASKCCSCCENKALNSERSFNAGLYACENELAHIVEKLVVALEYYRDFVHTTNVCDETGINLYMHEKGAKAKEALDFFREFKKEKK